MSTVNVSKEVYDVLERHSHASAQRWKTRFPFSAKAAEEIPVQLHEVNTFWRIQLGRLPIDTVPQRHCLSDDSVFEDWIRNFEVHVVPVIIANNLPS